MICRLKNRQNMFLLEKFGNKYPQQSFSVHNFKTESYILCPYDLFRGVDKLQLKQPPPPKKINKKQLCFKLIVSVCLSERN